MPTLTLGAGDTGVIGSGEPTPAVTTARKSLMLTLISGDAYIGWTPTVTAAGLTDAGIPLTVNQPVTFDAESLRFNATLKAFSASGAVINFQELRHP